MDTTCPQSRTLRIPMPASNRSERPASAIATFARKLGGAVCSLHINLGRKTTFVPGTSDRAIARLAHGPHREDIMRWNALALQYGGSRIRQ